MTTPYFEPEARTAIVEMLTTGMHAWLVEMQEGSFSRPYEAESLEILLDATATATAKLLEGHADKDALLRTFALEVLDRITPQQGA